MPSIVAISFTRTIVASVGGAIVAAAATNVAGAGFAATVVAALAVEEVATAGVVFGVGLVAAVAAPLGAGLLTAVLLGATAFVVTAFFAATLFVPGDGLLGSESSNALAEPTAHRLPITIKATNLRDVFI